MKTFVMVPTFNERDNIAELIDALTALPVPDLNVLVVDDDSPDGTSRIVQERFGSNPNVHLLVRRGRAGRGSAGRDGFLRCLELGADAVVEMDADLSHDPRDVPRLLAALSAAEVVVGSRKANGGQERGRSRFRRWLTGVSRAYTRSLLGIDVADCTSGFRCFTRQALESIDPSALVSRGPAIVEEVLFKAHRRGLRIREVPITFTERRRGRSKLRLSAVTAAGWTILRLRVLAFVGRV